MIQTIFCPGSYGTYLSWAVFTYSNLNKSGDVKLPFGSYGSAHLYRSDPGYKIVQPTHELLDSTTGAIFIEPTNWLEYTDNQLSKQRDYNNSLILNEMYHDYYTKLETVWSSDPEHWEHRELLSLMIQNTINETKQRINNIRIKLENPVVVTSTQILNEICGTLQKVFQHFALTQIVPNNTINTNHKTYLSMQKHIGKDTLVANIVNYTVNNHLMEIPAGLTLFDEAMIQHLLRDKGYELTCYKLNSFPTTTLELNSLTYQCN